MEHGHSLVVPPHFDGNNYAYWKVRMKAFLKSIDERVWNSVEYGWEKPTTPVSEWQTSQKEAAAFNSKAMNAIFNAVSMEEFKRISNVEVAHTAWNILQTVHEGTKAVKINKLQQLTTRFESIRMNDDESFDEFYAKLNDIVNSAYNLGEIYDQPKIVRKILRSLTEDFRPKVTAITESKDVDSIPVDELVGSLQSYELDLPKTNKSKSMALKSVDDVEDGGFDDELSATEIAYLAKNFRNFLRNNNRRARGKNTVEPRNFRRNDPIKVNNTEKPREKIGQPSNNSLGQQCYGCQGYGHMKSECPTYLKSKGKAMAVTLSDDEVSDNESVSDEDGNFIAFTATTVVNESMSVEENPSDGELSEDADLQQAYNKLCKVAAKDAMNVELGLKKIASLELDKKNLLVNLFDATELLNNVKSENMLLIDKVKCLELELSVAREQTNRSASSKLDHMLSVQKSPSDKTGLGFVESISVLGSSSTNFVPSTEPPKSEIVKSFVSEPVKPVDVAPPRKIRVDLQASHSRASTSSKGKLHDKPAWVCHFCGKSGHIRPNCFKLQAAKRANKPKVPVPQAQDPMVLIGELVKALNLYSNPGVAQNSNVNHNSNARVASKRFWMQKTRPN